MMHQQYQPQYPQEQDRLDSYRFAVQPFVKDENDFKKVPIKRKKPKLPQKQKRPQSEYDELRPDLEMDEHKISLNELFTRLNTNIDTGLMPEKVREILERDGPNALSPPPTMPEWVRFCRAMFSGFSLLLWLASMLSYFVYTCQAVRYEDTAGDMFYLGTVLIGVILVTSSFSYFQEAKSTLIIKSFKQMVPQYAVVKRGNERINVHAQELVVGDIIEVKEGDRFPADIRILGARHLKVDNSVMTGESQPVTRTNEYTSENLLVTRNLAFFTTYAVEGQCLGVVIATGDRTMVGKLAAVGEEEEEIHETPIFRDIAWLIYIFTGIGIIVSLTFFIISGIVGDYYIEALLYFIGLIVANVPEGLLSTISIALALTAKRMSSKNCLVKNLEAVETLGTTSAICTEMTGTLTQNKMYVSHVWYDNRIAIANDDQGSRRSMTWMALARCAVLSTKSEEEERQKSYRSNSGVAVDAALRAHMEQVMGSTLQMRRSNPKICQLGFNSVRKFCMSIHETDARNDERHLLVMKGAPENIFARCSTILFNGEERPLSDDIRAAFHGAFLELGSMGERVIGFCDYSLPVEDYPRGYQFDPDQENFPLTGLRFLGLMSLFDPPRANVPTAVDRCKAAGIKVCMITGEHPITAKAVAKGIGIISDDSDTVEDLAARRGCMVTDVNPRDARAAVVHGADLHDMTPAVLDDLLSRHVEIVFARTTAQQKLLIVETLQQQGHIVAVTGDGLNDCPALKKADLGVALGIAGSDVSKQAADCILLDDNFASIVGAVEEGRVIFDNIKKAVAYTLTSNFAEIMGFIAYLVLQIPLPMGILAILFIDLGTDVMPAVSLAYEEPELNIMRRDPRQTENKRVISEQLVGLSFAQIGMIEFAAGIFTYFCVMAENGFWPSRAVGIRSQWNSRPINDLEDSYGQEWNYVQRKVLEYSAQSAFFASIVVVQWANLMSVKTTRDSLFQVGMWNHRLTASLFYALFLALFFIYCPGMEHGMHMYPLRFTWWIPAMPFAFFVLCYEEIRKLFIRLLPRGGFLEREMSY